jgi:Type I phosphodiesterase / nucleotide pyrophosphatase
MKMGEDTPLLVCYISGMDVRRLTKTITPYIADLMDSCPHSYFTNLPSNELFPTLVTGVNPAVHGVWGVQYARNDTNSIACRLVDALPDALTTSFQCFRHYIDSSYDLPAIPPRRRRHFKLTRTKYRRRSKQPEALFNIGGIPTVMGLAGRDRAHYSFSSSSNPVKKVLPGLCANGPLIEILELYSLDRHQQWNLDRPGETEKFYAVIDDFIRKLHKKCRQKNIALMLVSDHGHEAIRSSIDICAKLQEMGLTDNDISYFIEVSSARFWPHTDRARNKATEWLSSINTGKLLRYDEMSAYNVPLTDDRYGELFFYLDPGYIFFPHDFHHPLARLFLGLTDSMQRSRLRDPRHKGNHGHLPYFEAERSLMLLADAGFEVESSQSEIFDVAPSMLSIIGIDPPASLPGRSIFRRRG